MTHEKQERIQGQGSATPGPWHTDEAHGCPWNIEDEHGEAVALAGAIIGDDRFGQPERTANAKLIASSPDLADALEALLARVLADPEVFIETDRDRAAVLREVETQARAALRKAGRQ